MIKLRKLAAAAVVILTAVSASGQSLGMLRMGHVRHSDGKREFVIAETVVTVDLTVRRTSTQAGPYARFAEKYFGVAAPLVDSEIHEITNAKIGWYDNDRQAGGDPGSVAADTPAVLTSLTRSTTDFVKVQPDKLSADHKSVEERAQEAAQTIFNLRKRRIELITGEYAETAFGEGLRAALERIDRMENDYLELFYGKELITTHTERYFISPDGYENTYTVCRFSVGAGLLTERVGRDGSRSENPQSTILMSEEPTHRGPQSGSSVSVESETGSSTLRGSKSIDNMAGEPVLLYLSPSRKVQKASEAQPVERKRSKQQIIAGYAVQDEVLCSVVYSDREMARRVVPIYQYGIKIMMEAESSAK